MSSRTGAAIPSNCARTIARAPIPSRTRCSQATEETNWDEVRDVGGTICCRAAQARAVPRATQAAAALTHLAHSPNNRDDPRLGWGRHSVALLREPDSSTAERLAARVTPSVYDWVDTATNAAAALRNLTRNNTQNQTRSATRWRRPSHRPPRAGRLVQRGLARGGRARRPRAQHAPRGADCDPRGGRHRAAVALLSAEPIGEAATKRRARSSTSPLRIRPTARRSGRPAVSSRLLLYSISGVRSRRTS